MSLARRATYALLAAVFLYPDAVRRERLAGAAARLADERDVIAPLAISSHLLSFLRRLREVDGRPGEELPGEYTRLFGLSAAGACPPYESRHLAADPAGAPEAAAALEREYAAWGVSVNPALGEFPDHIAVELEFMAELCAREAEAWERGAGEEAARVLERQRLFLRHHLGRWCPRFARAVARAAPGGFYAAAADVAAAFVHHDADLVALLLSHLPRALPRAGPGEGAPDEAREGAVP